MKLIPCITGFSNYLKIFKNRFGFMRIPLGGAIITLLLTIYLRFHLDNWIFKTDDYIPVIFIAVLIPLGIAIILKPLSKNRIIDATILILFFPLYIIVRLGYYSVPLITFLFLFIAPYFIWAILIQIGIVPPISSGVLLYVNLIFTSILFTYRGKKITQFIIEKIYKYKYDNSKLFTYLNPNSVRFYTFGFLLIVYIISNIENFSCKNIFQSEFWITYKSVIVEVLLTYVAIDRVLSAWKDHKENISKLSTPPPPTAPQSKTCP